MPIFARTKLIMHDDCWDFAGPELILNYKGPNPDLAYAKIRDLFVTVVGVNLAERVQERDFKWDREGKKETFSVEWHVCKDMDRFSYIYLRVRMKGEAEVKNHGKEGSFSVEINPFVRTEYPQDTVWERSIFYEIARTFWHKVFYQDKRRKYQDICRTITTNFLTELKAFFNLLPKR